jgi:ribosome-associated protein
VGSQAAAFKRPAPEFPQQYCGMLRHAGQSTPDVVPMLQVNRQIAIPLREIRFAFSRSSGPGGQNVNKLNTRVQLRWNVTESDCLPDAVKRRFLSKFSRRITASGEIIVTSQRFRDQGRNVADAMNKLREMILEVVTAPKKRKPAKISQRAKQRRLDDKRKRSEKKQLRKPMDG